MAKIIDHDDIFNKILVDIDDIVSGLLPSENDLCTNFDETIKKQTLLVKDLIENQTDLRRLKNESEKLNALHMMFWSNLLRENIEKVLVACDQELIEESIFMSLMLGIYRGMHFTYQKEEHFDFLTKLAISDTGRLYRKKGHEQKKEKIDHRVAPFLNEAKEKWDNGEQSFHDEMAKYLLDKYPEINDIFGNHVNTKKQLMKLLMPLARACNEICVNLH